LQVAGGKGPGRSVEKAVTDPLYFAATHCPVVLSGCDAPPSFWFWYHVTLQFGAVTLKDWNGIGSRVGNCAPCRGKASQGRLAGPAT
jgi:hypothetical protein